MEKVQRLLNVPSKLNDATSILQALAKLISEKLNSNAVQTCLNEQRNLKNGKEVIHLLFILNFKFYRVIISLYEN